MPNPRISDSGPQIPQGWVECGNCGRYAEPDRSDSTAVAGPICEGVEIKGVARCSIRLCSSCQDDFKCYYCGRPMCLNCSRPNPGGSQRICGGCEYASGF
jgi:hypothetical protein